LLARIGQHEAALLIYAHKLHDEKLAEAYCAKTYDPESEECKDVYLSLLKVRLTRFTSGCPCLLTRVLIQVYLKPADDGRPMVGPALALLNKHYREIDAPKALELLPPGTSLQKLYPFFEAVLRDRTEQRRGNMVYASVSIEAHWLSPRWAAICSSPKRCKSRNGSFVRAHRWFESQRYYAQRSRSPLSLTSLRTAIVPFATSASAPVCLRRIRTAQWCTTSAARTRTSVP
jgi:hypothetical protein